MNNNNLQQIFKNYIDHFEELNGGKKKEPTEWYKWRIANRFKNAMDSALKSEDEEFWKKLYEIKKETEDFIDNSIQPLYGLVQFSKKEPQTVKMMFRELYTDDGGDLDIRVKKIQEFLEKSRQLKEKYAPNSFLYQNDFHAVTAYLFLYDPDNNYVYKSRHANEFAGYIEFNNDFGSGDCVKLKNYYRMCDQIVEFLNKREKEIEEISALRAEMAKEELYADPAHHILVCDIIYCARQYHLFRDVSFKPRSRKEWNILEEKQEKAKEALAKLEKAQEEKRNLDAALEKLEACFEVGKEIVYKVYGKGAAAENGIIVEKRNGNITIQLENGAVKKVDLFVAVRESYIRSTADIANFEDIVTAIMRKSSIETSLSQAEHELVQYSEYI